MDKQDLIFYLKEHLRIEIDSEDEQGWDGEKSSVKVRVSLLLDNEVIDSSTCSV